LPTKDGGTLRTVLDARTYMLALPKRRETTAQWQRAAESLLAQADVAELTRAVDLALFYDAEVSTCRKCQRLSGALPCEPLEPRGLVTVSNTLRRAILILLSVFVMTATAHAVEATAQEFLDKYEHGDVTERQKLLTVIKGLEEGVSWADASNQAHGIARLYCPLGPIFSLEPERLIDMLRREVEARPDIRGEPWQLATIDALRNAFPCKRRRQ
jgi:hypothetical protein